MATIENKRPTLNIYLATNVQKTNNINQVESAKQNIAHRYSTEYKTQLVQELSNKRRRT